MRDPEQSSWGLALVRVLPLVWTRVVGRVHVDRVRSAPGLSAGVSLGSGRGRPCPQRARPWRGVLPRAWTRVVGPGASSSARCRYGRALSAP
ncbi:hypothetical protein HMPREF1550_00346 [Actinomyces sp. oral taxon 877 str. F0543]|nr:hypothetical protein HMPREF1550_00346 [Actinomyces sp. oral taxon 877 str. F0543]